MSDLLLPGDDDPLDLDDLSSDDDPPEGFEANPGHPEEVDAPRKRRKRRSPPKSPAHEARIDRYRGLVETRGWIFSPPTPERPISYLFDDLTVKQIVTLSAPGREHRRRA